MPFPFSKFKFHILITTSCLLLLGACKSGGSEEHAVAAVSTTGSCPADINALADNLLGKPLDNLRKMKNCYTQMYDTLLVDEESPEDTDEESTWPGIVVKVKNKPLFLAETNWTDKKHISRLTFYSSELRTNDLLATGAKLRNIRTNLLDTAFTEANDYLYVVSKKDQRVFLHLEDAENMLNENREYATDRINIQKLPDSLLVTDIVVMEER